MCPGFLLVFDYSGHQVNNHVLSKRNTKTALVMARTLSKTEQHRNCTRKVLTYEAKSHLLESSPKTLHFHPLQGPGKGKSQRLRYATSAAEKRCPQRTYRISSFQSFCLAPTNSATYLATTHSHKNSQNSCCFLRQSNGNVTKCICEVNTHKQHLTNTAYMAMCPNLSITSWCFNALPKTL